MSRIINTKHVIIRDITSVFKSDSDIFPVKMLTKSWLTFGSEVIFVVVRNVETATDVIICVVVTKTVVDCAVDNDDDDDDWNIIVIVFCESVESLTSSSKFFAVLLFFSMSGFEDVEVKVSSQFSSLENVIFERISSEVRVSFFKTLV